MMQRRCHQSNDSLGSVMKPRRDPGRGVPFLPLPTCPVRPSPPRPLFLPPSQRRHCRTAGYAHGGSCKVLLQPLSASSSLRALMFQALRPQGLAPRLPPLPPASLAAAHMQTHARARHTGSKSSATLAPARMCPPARPRSHVWLYAAGTQRAHEDRVGGLQEGQAARGALAVGRRRRSRRSCFSGGGGGGGGGRISSRWGPRQGQGLALILRCGPQCRGLCCRRHCLHRIFAGLCAWATVVLQRWRWHWRRRSLARTGAVASRAGRDLRAQRQDQPASSGSASHHMQR